MLSKVWANLRTRTSDVGFKARKAWPAVLAQISFLFLCQIFRLTEATIWIFFFLIPAFDNKGLSGIRRRFIFLFRQINRLNFFFVIFALYSIAFVWTLFFLLFIDNIQFFNLSHMLVSGIGLISSNFDNL